MQFLKLVFVPYAGKLFSILEGYRNEAAEAERVFVPYAGKLFSMLEKEDAAGRIPREGFRPLCGEAVFNPVVVREILSVDQLHKFSSPMRGSCFQ